MFPIHTRPPRPAIRSVSPPPRREPLAVDAAVDAAEQNDTGADGTESTVPNSRPSKADSISIRAAIKEYEGLYDELKAHNDRGRVLRENMARLRTDVQSFMQSRNLERLGTRDGRIAVRVTTSTTCTRPSKKETIRCVEETVGSKHPDLAKQLQQRLFDENTRTRTITKFDKREPGEKS